jgi:hypothetical protein
MSRRSLSGVLALALLLGFATAAVTVFAQAPAPKRTTLDMVAGKNGFKPNRFLQIGLRFSKDVVQIRSGGTLVVRNRTPGEPHSLSFVPKSAIPNTLKAVERCGAPKTICGKLGIAHQVDQQGNPAKPLVDVGTPGIDTASTAGDSYIFAPKGQKGSRMALQVSAKPGTTLYFFCALHPWMQGVLQVR